MSTISPLCILLTMPSAIPAPQSTTVYALRAGRVLSAPLSSYRLPEWFSATLVGPADVLPHSVAHLHQLAALAERIAPWATVHIVPTILSAVADTDYARDMASSSRTYRVGDTPYSQLLGSACWQGDADLVLVSMQILPRMLSTLCHELMHILWSSQEGALLSDTARQVVVDAVSDGMGLGEHGYLASVSERVSRAFQSYAWSRLEGVPAAAVVGGRLTVHSVFESIFSGELADVLLERDLVPDAQRIRAKRRARAIKLTA